MTPKLSLIIPARNEARRLPRTLAVYGRALTSRYGDEFEILVVGNGCTDDTIGVAQSCVATLPRLRVIEIAEPIGKGGAVLEGFRQACGQRVLFADADASTSPESLLDLADQLADADVVIGSRRLPASVIRRRQPWARRLCGRAFALTVRALFAMPYRDTQCGAKAFRRDAAQLLGPAVREARWAFDVDLLLAARAHGLRVRECPVEWAHCDGSRLSLLAAAREVGPALWRLRRRRASRPSDAGFSPATERGS